MDSGIFGYKSSTSPKVFLRGSSHCSYWRPSLLRIRDVLGHDDLTEANFKEIGDQLQANNTPGLYQRVLGGRG